MGADAPIKIVLAKKYTVISPIEIRADSAHAATSDFDTGIRHPSVSAHTMHMAEKRQVGLSTCWSQPFTTAKRRCSESDEKCMLTDSVEPEALQESSQTSGRPVLGSSSCDLLTPCTSECCMNPESPNQPVDPTVLSSTKQAIGSKNIYRCFNQQWYRKISWIHVCTTRNRVFCYYCMLAYSKGLLMLNSHYKTAFFVEGFQNWKKALERFHIHETSDCHKEAMLKLCSAQAPTIIEQLSSEASKTRAENRRMLMKVLSSLRFLLRQGLAIRGHREDDGNLVQLLQRRVDDDPQLARWLKNQQYMSHEIVNELIAGIGNELLRQLLTRIHEATWFAILADEATDVANHEQLSLSIRWVSHSYEINEDFIGLVHVP